METWLSHPATVHLPLALALILPIAFLATWMGISRRWLSPQSWYFPVAGLWLFLCSAILAYLTGEKAKVFSSAESSLLHNHEFIAQIFIVVNVALIFLSIFLLVPKLLRLRNWISSIIFIILILQALVAIRLGQIGGQIVFGP